MRGLLALLAVLGALLNTVVNASEMGDDGLHKQEWFSLTFKDIAEDIGDAAADEKRLVILVEQIGCSYCRKMHEVLLADPEVSAYIQANFNVVQMNMFGDEEVTDLDGEALAEKEAIIKWGVMFTPMIMFMPEEPLSSGHAGEQAVAAMPGSFGKSTFLDAFRWVREKGYETDEHFQKYHARMLADRTAAGKSETE